MRAAELFRYGMLALPLAFAGLPLYIHAPDFYATQHGLSLAAMGLVLLALRLVDALQDPLLGLLSDRAARWRPLLMGVAALLLLGAFAGLFGPPANVTLQWFALMLFLATTAFSFLSINLNALGGLWATDTHGRTVIAASREAASVLGLLLAVMLPTVLQQQFPAQQAFGMLSALLALLLLVAMPLFLYWYRATPSVRADAAVHSPLPRLSPSMPRYLRRFYGVCGLSMLASAIPTVLVLFFIRDRLQAETYAGLFLGIYFVAAAAGMPAWQALSRRLGKLRAWRLSMLLAVLSFGWAVLLDAGDLLPYALICLFAGFAFGAELALPPSILADQLEHFGLREQAGLSYSILTFLAKLGLALGSALAFGLLELSGFRAGGVNSADALLALSFCYALLPCLIKCGALLLLGRMGELHENLGHRRSGECRSYA